MCLTTISWQDCDATNKIKEFAKEKNPKWAYIEITSRCNLSCFYCYASEFVNSPSLDMESSFFQHIIDVVSNMGVVQVTLGGGEPLMHPNIVQFVEYAAKSKGLVVHMTSNGLLLRPGLAKRLANAGLSQIQMNIDSIRSETHDLIRGKKGAFESVITAFKEALAAGITCVSQTVANRTNQFEIIEIFKLARNLGVQRCRIWDMVETGKNKNSEERLTLQEKAELLNKVLAFSSETKAANIVSYDPFFRSEKAKNTSVYHVPCPPSLGMSFSISIDGSVYPCVISRQKSIGHISNIGSLRRYPEKGQFEENKVLCANR